MSKSSIKEKPQSNTATSPRDAEEIAKYGYVAGGWVPKLTDWKEAVPNALSAILVSIFVVVMAVSYIEALPKDRPNPVHQEYYYPKIALFILGYYLFLAGSRWYESDSHVLYEMLWACNMGMVFSVVGMLTNSPLLSGLSTALVALDQLLWYFDMIGFLLKGCKKFPIGVAGYLLWPSTGRMKKITAFHHLWFLPLLLYTLNWEFPQYAFPMAVFASLILSVTARIHTPFHCLLPKEPGATEHKVLYLNINFAYAFWKDIKVPFLHWFDHKPVALYLPYIVITANAVLNYPTFLLLTGLLKLVR